VSYSAIPASLILEIASQNGHYTQLPLPLDLAPEYVLPEEYFTDIHVGYEYIPSTSCTKCSTTQTVDHPGFANLRNALESDKYITTERNWSNGDTVSKRFRLNSKWFEVGDKFPCAVAMHNHLRRK